MRRSPRTVLLGSIDYFGTPRFRLNLSPRQQRTMVAFAAETHSDMGSFRPSDTRGDGAPVWCAQRLPNAAAWSRANSAMPRASIPVRSFTAEVTWDSQPREYAVK